MAVRRGGPSLINSHCNPSPRLASPRRYRALREWLLAAVALHAAVCVACVAPRWAPPSLVRYNLLSLLVRATGLDWLLLGPLALQVRAGGWEGGRERGLERGQAVPCRAGRAGLEGPACLPPLFCHQAVPSRAPHRAASARFSLLPPARPA